MYKNINDIAIDKVTPAITDNFKKQSLKPPSAVVRSWQRCLESHGLRPEQKAVSIVLSERELATSTDSCADFIRIAEQGVTSLQHKMWPSGYAILLADNKATTLAARLPDGFDESVGKHLITGARWSEQLAGTNGIGTCLLERKPICVHKQEHFLSDNSNLSCAAAPIFSPLGELLGCLNASTVASETSEQQRLLSLQLVHAQTLSIEDEYLRLSYPDCFLITLHLSASSPYSSHPVLLAVNDQGRIIGANRIAFTLSREITSLSKKLLGVQLDQIIGESIDSLVNITAGGRLTSKLVIEELGEAHLSMRLPKNQIQHSSITKNTPLRTTPQATRRHPSLSELCVNDSKLSNSASLLHKVMNKDIAILLTGETGTGKEAFAHAIHQESNRQKAPFIALNCAAIPESLIESELFGYSSGSFTGAHKTGRKGKLQQAAGGTLFLDEIGDMPLELQTRLLRVLAEREIQALGSDETIPLDIQLISATHQNLMQLVDENRFRLDLYYRLNGITLELPALRDRSDLKSLTETLLRQESADKATAPYLDKAAFDALHRYHWPGNIRELINILRLANATADGSCISLQHLPDEIQHLTEQTIPSHRGLAEDIQTNASAETLRVVRDKHEAQQLLQQLRLHKWNISRTAKRLAISRSSIYRKMKKFQIVHPHEYL